MVSTGISALRSAWRRSACAAAQPLGAGGADVVLAERVEQRRAHDAGEDRGLRQRQRDRRQGQRLAAPASRPASQPGKPPAENQRRFTAKTQHQQHREPEVRHRDPELGRAHDAGVGRACRAAPPPRCRPGRRSASRAPARRARAAATPAAGRRPCRRPACGRCRRCRSRPGACRRPSRGSAPPARRRGRARRGAPPPPPGCAFSPSM